MADDWPEGLVIPKTSQPQQPDNLKISEERREFLLRCGKYAAVTPPAMALLLAVSAVPEEAAASSWHHRGGTAAAMAMPAVKGMAIAGAIDGVPDASDLINPTFHPARPKQSPRPHLCHG